MDMDYSKIFLKKVRFIQILQVINNWTSVPNVVSSESIPGDFGTLDIMSHCLSPLGIH